MKITESAFGCTSFGTPVKQYTLENSRGVSVRLISYGAAVRSVVLPDRSGRMRDVVLGYDSIADYEAQGAYFFGAVIGRVANRIENARFTLNGKEYRLSANHEGQNCLHGGERGFDKRCWEGRADGESVRFSYSSPDGEEGFPGNLRTTVNYRLTEDDRMIIDEHAVSDKDTIVNLTNHTYFNLDGHDKGSIGDHWMQIFSDRFAESDEQCLATGNLISVEHTPFDFRRGRQIGDVIDEKHCQLLQTGGYDHSFCIRDYNGMVRQAADVYAEGSGIRMRVLTNKPAIHFYSGNFMKTIGGKQGAVYGYRGGFCLETQFLPNAMKCFLFPSIVLRKGEEYLFRTIYEFSVK